MPHAIPSVVPGLQALILCGPGASLNTFTSNPEEFPKALVPIANRPMIWYALDFCYRMGITGIFLITPPSSSKAIDAALSQNPHLTSLPAPRATILAPEGLSQTSGTAEILRLPEVRAALQNDFVILPCDLICEIPGHHFLETWMARQPSYGGVSAGINVRNNQQRHPDAGHRGGLGVWFSTKGEGSVKREETDFIMTTPIHEGEIITASSLDSRNVSRLVYSTTTDTVNDITEDKEHFPVRHRLIRHYGRVKVLTKYRDAHLYIFPLWILDFVEHNDTFDNISEDVIGWWAKCGWQEGLGEKLGLRSIVEGPTSPGSARDQDDELESSMNVVGMSSTHSEEKASQAQLSVPPILAYVQPGELQQPLIRRVDTAALLLFVSLRLAKLPSVDEAGREAASPFAHANKIAYPAGVAQRCTVTRNDCLLGDNVKVEEKCVIKESVVGANCQIKSGARITRCVLMDGVVVEEKAQLTGCILGRRSQVGKECDLRECEVQDGNKVPDQTDAKGEKFMVFEGLEDDDSEGGGMDLGDEIEF